MANVKTAISLEKQLFEKVNVMAKNLNISRSRLFSIAVQEYLKRCQNIELLDKINDAYDDIDGINSDIVTKMRPNHYKMVKDQW
ncbi:MAG: CopG family transcriptional regulator [Desulfobacteraceae bacterium]|nr:CopG family transcriptional regulator [Desulfobacteraceae bacterium]MBU4054379.1 CopG family transcriptional regulator [Pseudomonadota bacterium]